MAIFLNILFLILGMVLLIKGADFFVSGASAVAKRFKIPSLFIGLTIVALGTSLPELSVSLAGAIKKNVDMSVGNIVGSNFMNLFLIFGISALIRPLPIFYPARRWTLLSRSMSGHQRYGRMKRHRGFIRHCGIRIMCVIFIPRTAI